MSEAVEYEADPKADARRAAREAERAEAARAKAAEAHRWWAAHRAAADQEREARRVLLLAQEAEARHHWRAKHPSDLWPLADLEALAAAQVVEGAESRVNTVVQARRGAQWNLARLGVWPEDDEPDDDDVTRCSSHGCRGFKALDDDGRCPHHRE